MIFFIAELLIDALYTKSSASLLLFVVEWDIRNKQVIVLALTFATTIRNCMALATEHSSLGFCSMQVHILDPTLGPQMINNDIQNADGSPIRFADLDGTLLKFATEARPAKRAFAWYAEQGLRHAKKVGWAAATQLTVPPIAWGSDTCDAGIRDRFFGDALALQSAEVIEAVSSR